MSFLAFRPSNFIIGSPGISSLEMEDGGTFQSLQQVSQYLTIFPHVCINIFHWLYFSGEPWLIHDIKMNDLAKPWWEQVCVSLSYPAPFLSLSQHPYPPLPWLNRWCAWHPQGPQWLDDPDSATTPSFQTWYSLPLGTRPLLCGSWPEMRWTMFSHSVLFGVTLTLLVVISSDGQFALSGSGDGTLYLWDLTMGTTMHHTKDVLSVAFSDNWQISSGSWDKTIKLWTISGVCKYTFQNENRSEWVSCVSFLPNNSNPIILSCAGTKWSRYGTLQTASWSPATSATQAPWTLWPSLQMDLSVLLEARMDRPCCEIWMKASTFIH